MIFNCEHCKEELTINNPNDIAQITQNPAIKATCVHCKQKTSIVPKVPPPPPPPPPPIADNDTTKVDAPEGYGWLMVHDENADKQTFDLKLGNNQIGRNHHLSTADFLIKTADPYMSKNHCSITVMLRPNNTLAYIVKDTGSTNGTYLNEVKLKAADMLYLQDGDKLQIGRTKVIIKTITRTPAAESAIGGQSFGKTIIA